MSLAFLTTHIQFLTSTEKATLCKKLLDEVTAEDRVEIFTSIYPSRNPREESYYGKRALEEITLRARVLPAAYKITLCKTLLGWMSAEDRQDVCRNKYMSGGFVEKGGSEKKNCVGEGFVRKMLWDKRSRGGPSSLVRDGEVDMI